MQIFVKSLHLGIDRVDLLFRWRTPGIRSEERRGKKKRENEE